MNDTTAALDANGQLLAEGDRVVIKFDQRICNALGLSDCRVQHDGEQIVIDAILWEHGYGGSWRVTMRDGAISKFLTWPARMVVKQAGGLKDLIRRYRQGGL